MKMKYLFFILFVMLITIISIFFFERESFQKVPPCPNCNIIMINMTNLRYDHVSSNGYTRPTTPNIDTLARESVVFNKAFSHSSWTLPEGISIFTSLYPYTHGVMNRYDGSTLSKSTTTLIDILKKNKYYTAAFTGGFDYNPDFGLTSRFDLYDECTRGGDSSYPRQHGPKNQAGPSQYGKLQCSVPKAVEWLKENSKKKFFLFVQGFDTHCPFSQSGGKRFDKDYKGTVDFSNCLWTTEKSLPTQQDGKTLYPVLSMNKDGNRTVLLTDRDIEHLIALYDESIVDADTKVGQLLDTLKELNLLENTIVIFTSEHGDIFGKHGRFMRGGPLRGTFYDDVLHIPLLIKHPQISPKRIDQLVQQIDIAPTILDFLDINPPTQFVGKSAIPTIQNKDINDYVYAGSIFNPDIISFFPKTKIEAIRNNNWKLIREENASNKSLLSDIELYDIKNDVEEKENLATKNPDVVKDLQQKLSEWSKKATNN